jgi:hypothetical protein
METPGTIPEEIPKWKVSQLSFLQILRDMVFENGTYNQLE